MHSDQGIVMLLHERGAKVLVERDEDLVADVEDTVLIPTAA
jgi:hypothetical protein